MIAHLNKIEEKPASRRLFRDWANRWGVFLILTGILTAGWWLSIGGLPSWSACPLKKLSGWDCPGCGLTRSFLSMARGDWSGAFQFNAAGPALYAVFFMAWLMQLLPEGNRFKIWLLTLWKKGQRPVSLVIVLLLIGQWVIKTLAHAVLAGRN